METWPRDPGHNLTQPSAHRAGTGPTALLSRGASAEDVIRIESRKRAAETRQTARRRVEGRLEALVRSLGSVAVLPGDEEERAEIDSLLRELERLAPIRRPLGGSRGGDGLAYDWKRSGELEGVARGSRQEAPRKELEGVWRLVYASNGTYVTRSPPVQVRVGGRSPAVKVLVGY